MGGSAGSLLDSCPADLWPRLRRLLAASVSKACKVRPQHLHSAELQVCLQTRLCPAKVTAALHRALLGSVVASSLRDLWCRSEGITELPLGLALPPTLMGGEGARHQDT